MFKFFKNLRTYFFYKKVLRKHEEELYQKFNLKIDAVGRLYTIYSINPADYKSYGDALLDSEFKKYISSVDRYLIKLNLADMYGMSNKDLLFENNLKVVIRYKPLDIALIANITVAVTLTIIASLIIGGAIFLAI
jgi:hypothetical protein